MTTRSCGGWDNSEASVGESQFAVGPIILVLTPHPAARLKPLRRGEGPALFPLRGVLMNFVFQPAMTTDDTDFTDEQWKTGSYPCYPCHPWSESHFENTSNNVGAIRVWQVLLK